LMIQLEGEMATYHRKLAPLPLLILESRRLELDRGSLAFELRIKASTKPALTIDWLKPVLEGSEWCFKWTQTDTELQLEGVVGWLHQFGFSSSPFDRLPDIPASINWLAGGDSPCSWPLVSKFPLYAGIYQWPGLSPELAIELGDGASGALVTVAIEIKETYLQPRFELHFSQLGYAWLAHYFRRCDQAEADDHGLLEVQTTISKLGFSPKIATTAFFDAIAAFAENG